mgnify:CR=1 FL=1
MDDVKRMGTGRPRAPADHVKWHKQLCEIAAVEMDWLQRLTSGDDAMKQISAILTGKSR